MGNCRFLRQKKQVKINGEWVDTRSFRYLPLCYGENPCVIIVKDGGTNGRATVTLSNSEEKKLFLDRNGNGYLALGSNDSISTINLSPKEASQSCVVEISGCKLEKIKVTGANSLIISCSTFNSNPGNWISPDEPRFDATSIIFKDTNTSNLTNMSFMFYNCRGLTSLDISHFDTSNVTTMESMFRECNKLTSLNVSSFNTRNVTDMGAMFVYCTNLTSIDVSNFDTRNVTYMHGMFAGCENLTSLDVSNFNTSNVISMVRMFDECRNLTNLDVSNFNTSKVTDMRHMFSDCTRLTSLNLSGWDMRNVDYKHSMNIFYRTSNLKTIRMIGCNQTTIDKIKNALDYNNILDKVTIITN